MTIVEDTIEETTRRHRNMVRPRLDNRSRRRGSHNDQLECASNRVRQ
jgi:hypothetical protein